MNRIEQLYNEWQSLQPLKPEDQSRLDRKFMLEFNYNSNHIEGNTLTYGQTELLLLFGKVVDEANMKDLEEMKAHNVCLKMMQTEAAEKDKPLTETFIRQLHRTMLREDYVCYRQLLDGTNTSYTVHAGVYKTRPNSVITVTGERFEYASPEETPALMADLVNWYNEAEAKAELSPIELASVFHYRYIRIHPFEDGNGRIARLMVNYILARHNYPMIVVKSKDKKSYLTALNRCDVNVGLVPADGAHADLEQLSAFVDYMSGCLETAFEVCIKAAKGESIEDADDWKKNLKLKYGDKMNRPALTEEMKDKIVKTVYQPLLKHIDTELSGFYSLFVTFNWEPGVAEFEWDNQCAECRSEIVFSKESIIPGATSTQTIAMQLTFQQFVYAINIYVVNRHNYIHYLYRKEMSYREVLSEQDMENIVNKIGGYLHCFLENNDSL